FPKRRLEATATRRSSEGRNLMCPACVATVALIAAGAPTTGGLAALRPKDHDRLFLPATQKVDVYSDESPSKEKCPPPCSPNVEDSQHPINACPSMKNVGKVSISRPLVRLQSTSTRRSRHAIPAANLRARG